MKYKGKEVVNFTRMDEFGQRNKMQTTDGYFVIPRAAMTQELNQLRAFYDDVSKAFKKAAAIAAKQEQDNG